MRKYYVYVHINKDNGKRYYGMTSQKPHRRWGRGGNRYAGNQRFDAAIKQHGWDGFAHEVLAQGLSFEQARHMEEALIRRHDTTNPAKGYNCHSACHPRRETAFHKIAAAKIGHPVTQATREKIRNAVSRSAVEQIAPCGTIVKTYPSLTDAAKALGVHKGHICAAARGYRKAVRGFMWRYANEGLSHA